MVGDNDLIRQYAEHRSEAAFAELVRRHVQMVYAAALRQVNGDFQLAEDVTQTVFTDLASKAGRLRRISSVAGWLYCSTRFAAANVIRAENRRRAREQTAAVMNEIHATPDPHWEELRPVIDEALAKLGDADREAIVLRFFESNEFPAMATLLGVSESGARMRVERALEKLKVVLARRGLVTTGVMLAGSLQAAPVAPIPAHLAVGIVGAAISHSAAGATSTMSVTKLFLMKKIVLVAAGVVAASVATVAIVKHQHRKALRAVVVKSDWMKQEAGIRKFGADVEMIVGPDETLVVGGWSQHPGRRTFVFITPTWIDTVGNRLKSLPTPKSQVTLETSVIEASEESTTSAGLLSNYVSQDTSSAGAKYPSKQAYEMIQAIKQSGQAKGITTPKVTTLAGRDTTIRGEPGKYLGVVFVQSHPALAADGASFDLKTKVEIKQASTK